MVLKSRGQSSASAPLTVEQRLDRLEAENVSLKAENAALKAKPSAKQPKAARPESVFTESDVIEMTADDWTELAGEFYTRKADGSYIPTITRRGGERVTMKPGLDYGVYLFIKGIGQQMNRRSFVELSVKQIAACRNILAYCLEKDLVEQPEAAVVAAPAKKAGRPRKSAATV